ncbi:MAG: hypothetical protein DRP01_11315, partial [Archaeoglobales archaeon]
PYPVNLSPGRLGFYTFLGTLFLCFVTTVLSRIRVTGSRSIRTYDWLQAVSPVWFSLLFYFYALSFLVISSSIPPLFQRYVIVPWYYYPVKLGIVGSLALIWTSYIPWRNIRAFIGLFWAALSFIIIIRLGSTLFQFQTIIWLEFRTFTFIFFSLLPLASSALLGVLKAITIRFHGPIKLLLSGIIVTLTLIAGLGSTLLSAELWRLRGSAVPKEAIHVAAELAEKTGLSSWVLTLSEDSFNILRYAGVARIAPTEWSHYYAFLHASKPGTYVRLLEDGRIGYVFITPTDMAFFMPEGPFLGRLVRYLPLACREGSFNGYEVPQMTYPQGSSDIALVLPDKGLYGPFEFALLTLSVSSVHYTTVLPDDVALANYSIIFVIDQPGVEINSLLSLCEVGRTVVVQNWAGYGPLAEYLSISQTGIQEDADGLRCGNRTEQLPTFNVPELSFDSARLTPIAYFTDGGSDVAPYALEMCVGEGRFIYLNTYPYLLVLNSTDGMLRREAFIRLGAFLNVLRDVVPLVSPGPAIRGYPHFHRYFIGDVRLLGDVLLRTNGLILSREVVASVSRPIEHGYSELQELTIKGHVSMLIHSEEATLSPSAVPSSLYVEADMRNRCSITFMLSEGSILVLNFTDGIEIFRGGQAGLEVEVNLRTPVKMLMRTPYVHVDGAVNFECLYYPGARPAIFVQPQNKPTQARGSVSFRVLNADVGLSLLTDLQVGGDIWITEDISCYYPSLKIDWGKVFLSTDNIAILALSSLIAYAVGALKMGAPCTSRHAHEKQQITR